MAPHLCLVITWELFLWLAGVVMLVYYAIVVALFFRQDVKRKSQQPVRALGKPVHPVEPLADVTTVLQSPVYTSVHELLEDLKRVYADVNVSAPVKEQLLDAIGTLLKKYAAIRHSPFEPSLNHNIAAELQQRFQLSVTAE